MPPRRSGMRAAPSKLECWQASVHGALPRRTAEKPAVLVGRVHAAPRRAGARYDEGLPVAGPKAEDDDDGEG